MTRCHSSPVTPGGRARLGVVPTVWAALGYRLATSEEDSWWKEDTTHFSDVTWKCGTPSCQVM